jgi:chaperonin GroES
VPVDVKVGDHVLFGKFAGALVRLSGESEDVLVLREDEILGVIEDERQESPPQQVKRPGKHGRPAELP